MNIDLGLIHAEGWLGLSFCQVVFMK